MQNNNKLDNINPTNSTDQLFRKLALKINKSVAYSFFLASRDGTYVL